MPNFEQTFGDNDEYRATLDISPGLTQGWVNGPDGYSASLEWLLEEGTLTCGMDDVLVTQDIIEEIDQWAEENGY